MDRQSLCSGTPARVAVIVPAYGVAHLLGEALASLQAQTLTEWECVVIDDGPPDDVATAVAPFLSDSRIRFLATDNHGVSSARNRAIAASQAPLIALLDGDDLFAPDYLATTVPLLENDATIRLATCNARLFGAVQGLRHCVERPHAQTGSLADVLDRSFNVYIGSTFRRADFDQVGGFDTNMAHSEDFDFWVRLLMLGGQAHYTDAALGHYRIRAGSASASCQRLLMGNIKTYEKAATALPPDSPEQPLLARLIAQNRVALRFEHAIDRIIDGDTHGGLQELLACPDQASGKKLQWLIALSRLYPPIARPLFQWRRLAHSRGAVAHNPIARLRQLRV
jgi:glycosyltransferase involved in cell wall biosynthesis